jgi:hypothetical protein
MESIPRPPQTRARTKDDLTKWIAKHPGVPFPSVKAIADSKLLHPLHQAAFDEMAAATRRRGSRNDRWTEERAALPRCVHECNGSEQD